MKKLPLDKRTIFFSVLIIALSLGIAKGLSTLQNRRQLSLKSELESEHKRVELLNELLQAQGQIDTLKKKLLKKTQGDILQGAIRDAVKASRIELVKLEQGSQIAQKDSMYIIQPITATVTGTYRQLVAFIDKIEKGQFFVQLTSIHCAVKEPLTYAMLYKPAGEDIERGLSSELELMAIYVKK